MTAAQKLEATEARATLLAWIPKDSIVYTILRHVSRSGMQRQVSVVVIGSEGLPLHPNYAVAKLLGARLNRSGMRDAIIRTGCGYDVAADTVANLAMALYGSPNALRHEAL